MPRNGMKFGVNTINFGPGTSPASLERWARFAEAVGFHLVMISDHVAITPDVHSRYPAPFYDPFITLGWLAGITSRVELGTTVAILPYRHPLQTARMVSNLDQLSGGRFIFGIGVGWAKQEFEALAVPFDRRGRLTNEYLAAIKTLWTNDVASFDGEFVSFKDVHTAPRAVRSPHPPIWVGGSSEGALERAVRYGDAWHPLQIRMAWLRDQGLPRLRKMADAASKPVPALCPRISLLLTDSRLDDEKRLAGQGTLDQVRADLEQLALLGAQYVLFDTYTGRPEATLHPESDWAMLATLADKALDLQNGTLR